MPRVALRRQLFILAVAGILPLAALAGAGLAALFQQQREESQRRALSITRALTTAVQAELQRSLSALEVLGASASLRRGDLATFTSTARRAVQSQPQWRTLILSRPDGEPVMNTRVAEGALPPLVEPDSFRRVVETRKPTVGSIARGSDRYAIPLRVPIVVGDDLRYVLTGVATPDPFFEILRRQQVPESWVISVFDGRGMRVARSRGGDQFYATPAGETLRTLMAGHGNEGAGITHTLEGDAVYTAFSRLPDTGWSVAIGIPVADVNASAIRTTAIYALAVLVSILVGLAVAGALARNITSATVMLGRAARRLGTGERPEVSETGIAEFQEVANAITDAALKRSAYEREREQLLESEQVARLEAETMNRAKDQFLAMLGHELRNPLAALSNASSLLGHEPSDPRMATRAREVIQRQVAHLSRLTDDLLDAARAILGKIELRVEPVDLAATARHVMQAFSAGGRLGRHRVVENLESAWVRGDPVRIDQVVSNLLGNALKYTPPGGTITVSTKCTGAECELRITDTGVGLSPELAARVFDLFVQGKRNLDRSEGGLGIGLTLVRRLTELHGGVVEVHSEGEDRGSEFTVRLPAIEPVAPVARPARVAPAGGLSILLVEDNEDARETLKALLELLGHDVRTASDGQAGVAAALAQPPDIAFVDLGLPLVDGYDVARRIRASGNRRTFLVALTGYGAQEDRDRALAAGFDAHVTKPIELPALTDLLAASAASTGDRAASA